LKSAGTKTIFTLDVFPFSNHSSSPKLILSCQGYLMDLCPPPFGFVDDLRKLHGLEMEQGPPKSGGDLEGP